MKRGFWTLWERTMLSRLWIKDPVPASTLLQRAEEQLLGMQGRLQASHPPLMPSPLSTDVSWAVGTPRLSGGPAWPRGDSCSCFTPLKGAGDGREQ